MSDTGLFITFEGGEGSGKTTLINRIGEKLTNSNRRVLTTREPGGTPQGEQVRKLIVQGESASWSPLEEVLLIFAARHAHVEQIIRPALARGKIVLCDRFTDSTRAYQGYGHGLDLGVIEKVNDLVIDGFTPDLTFVLDVDPKVGLERSKQRLTAEKFGGTPLEDRFENLDLAFHERLREGFLDLAVKNSDRCVVIPDGLGMDDVASRVYAALLERIEEHES